jgi:endoglucanase
MLLAYFAHADSKAPWDEALNGLPKLAGTEGGFAMDWMKAEAGGIKPSSAPASAQSGKDDVQPEGSYDAIRVYLWVGMADAKTHSVKLTLEKLKGMARYLGTHLTPPLKVDAGGKVLDPDAPPGFSAAVIPYLHALGLGTLQKAQTDRLQATRDAGSGLYGRDGRYYDQNLALFATGWGEGRFRFEADGRLRVQWQ